MTVSTSTNAVVDRGITPVETQHASTTHVAVNNADFLLVFGRIVPFFGSDGLVPRVQVEPVAAVTLSPMVAKHLAAQLAQAVQTFEQQTKVAIPMLGPVSEVESDVPETDV